MRDRDRFRVLFWMSDGAEIPGGHRTQLTKTAAAVAALGHDVALSTDPHADCEGFDIVHAFWPTPEQVRSARNAGCKVAISTVYNPIRFTHGLDQPREWHELVRIRSRQAVRSALRALQGHQIESADRTLERITRTRLAYESADLLLPNSAGELADIHNDLGVTTTAAIVPNAIDAALFLSSPIPDFDKRRGVICVGRIEPHKNQVLLAEACAALGIPLTLVGAKHPHHPGYLERCVRAYPGVRWIDQLDQRDLVPMYDAARAHALCSWFETTGLSSLEAAARGCSIITTNRGYAGEYFGEEATYCDPATRDSVVRAVQQAIELPPSPRLRKRVMERFTWESTAAATVAAYRASLGHDTRANMSEQEGNGTSDT